MEYINGEDWNEFDHHFSGAMSWLRRRALRNELRYLRSVESAKRLSAWQGLRLQELEALDKNVHLEN